tara:strand:+ start:381 stop:818 length:438 start_codon:yes stop_codon:yes gene_type:complete
MTRPLYLVAVDGSEFGERAAERAINLAEQIGAKVKLITVMDWSYLQTQVIDGVAPPLLDPTTQEDNVTNRVLTPLVTKYHNSTVDITTELVWGVPVEVILEQVKKSHANLLFVGRHGRSRIVDILLGSVANQLAHRVGIPIILVP